MKYVLVIFLVLVIVIIAVTVVVRNDQVVTFNYMLAQGQCRVSTLLINFFCCQIYDRLACLWFILVAYSSGADALRAQIETTSSNSLYQQKRYIPASPLLKE